MAVRVSIVEDDRVTRETLSALVRQEPGLQFVAAYADAESAIDDVPRRTPDVLVVDIGLSPKGSDRLDGPQCVASLKAVRPDLLALMLTVYDDHDRVMEAIRAGASGYILKRSPPRRHSQGDQGPPCGWRPALDACGQDDHRLIPWAKVRRSKT
jgi:DNA-binding NarL/FixJ family response regulator